MGQEISPAPRIKESVETLPDQHPGVLQKQQLRRRTIGVHDSAGAVNENCIGTGFDQLAVARFARVQPIGIAMGLNEESYCASCRAHRTMDPTASAYL
jgi:hypothetical protein